MAAPSVPAENLPVPTAGQLLQSFGCDWETSMALASIRSRRHRMVVKQLLQSSYGTGTSSQLTVLAASISPLAASISPSKFGKSILKSTRDVESRSSAPSKNPIRAADLNLIDLDGGGCLIDLNGGGYDDSDRRNRKSYNYDLDNPMISEVPASIMTLEEVRADLEKIGHLQPIGVLGVSDYIGPLDGKLLDNPIMCAAVTAIMEKLGYLKPIDGGGYHEIQSIQPAVERYQLNHGLDPTGFIDLPTASMMLSRLCGVPDIVDGMNLTRLHGSDASCLTLHSGDVRKWDRFHLFYKFESNFFDKAKPSFRLALEEWARHSNFTFTERLGEGAVDILAGFYSGKHPGKHFDCVPFNGPRGPVGHCTNLPDVRVHFDKIQEWSFFNHKGRFVDMETAALHEIGHALGLSHSSDENSVMYSGISTCLIRRRLTTGDIEALRSLYS